MTRDAGISKELARGTFTDEMLENMRSRIGTEIRTEGCVNNEVADRMAILRFAEGIGRFYHTADGQPAKLRHIVLQTVIRVEGNRAWGRSQWLEMANHGPGDEPKIGTYGIYEDEFVKVGGRWLIARRNVLNEFIPNRSSGPENPVAEMDALAAASLAR